MLNDAGKLKNTLMVKQADGDENCASDTQRGMPNEPLPYELNYNSLMDIPVYLTHLGHCPISFLSI